MKRLFYTAFLKLKTNSLASLIWLTFNKRALCIIVKVLLSAAVRRVIKIPLYGKTPDGRNVNTLELI